MIVVTGGTGTVGSRLVQLLVERGEQVRVLCRDRRRAQTLFGDRVETFPVDLADPGSLASVLCGADRLFLLTTAAAVPDSQRAQEHNVITAARTAGVRQVVKLSAHGAHEQSPIGFVRGHWESERELEASGLAYTILRPGGYLQNFHRIGTDGAIHTCAQDGRTALVDANDIAAVAAVALTEDGHEGRTYTLTGPQAHTYDEAAAILSAAAGRTITHVRVPPAALVEAMAGAGLPRWLARDLTTQYEVIAAGDYDEISGDVEVVTGRPARSVATFAADEFAGGGATSSVGQRPSATTTSSMLNIFTENPLAALEFYRDRLGFAVSSCWPNQDTPEHVVLQLGTSLLAVSHPAAVKSTGLTPASGSTFELVVSCEDVDRETARLRAGGTRILIEPYHHLGGHRRAYVADPDGNWIALVDTQPGREADPR